MRARAIISSSLKTKEGKKCAKSRQIIGTQTRPTLPMDCSNVSQAFPWHMYNVFKILDHFRSTSVIYDIVHMFICK